VMSPVHI